MRDDRRDEMIAELLRLNGLLAEAIQSANELTREAIQNAHDARELNRLARLQKEDPKAFREFVDQAIGTYQPPPPKPRHRPQQKEFRKWGVFRGRFLQVEQETEGRLDRARTAELVGIVLRTMERILEDSYGVDRHLWPPSDWPEEAPLPDFDDE